jgi:3-deoxy-manno-octulosonate cytidylyltransferase (CMP-KDO synthetase)
VSDKDDVIGVVPARYGSTRFPGKPLVPIAGKPMIEHVYRRASRASLLSQVIVATDDSRIMDAVSSFGGKAMMTSSEHPSGTDRLMEVAETLKAPFFVNIQGDEPLINPDHIDACARALLEGAEMSTLAARIRFRHEVFDRGVAKVLIDAKGYAICFSRSAIPFPGKFLARGEDIDLECSPYFRHVGVYGYTLATLRALAGAGQCEMERVESLEQLRALYLGIKIKVEIVDSVTPHVDEPADVQEVERTIKAKGNS